MYFYYIVLSFVFWVYLYTYSAHLKNAKSTYIFVLFLFFILVSGIRAPSVGGDLNHYLPVMNRLENKVGKICSLLEQSMVMFLQSYVRLPILLIQVDNLSCL